MERMFRSTANSFTSSSSAASTMTSGIVFTTSAGENSTGSTANSASNYISNSIGALNKSSYKISKPINRNPNPNPSPDLIRASLPQSSAICAACPQQQSQPPVYNIDKNDFRDVVQKLTGSPAHLPNRQPFSTVMVISPSPPRPSTISEPLSRLHRIRPPPLAQVSTHNPSPIPSAASPFCDGWIRAPLSPLPPFPTVSAAAESPISAYMRRLYSGQSMLAPSPSGLPSQPQLIPLSPLSFSCAPSPRTAAANQAMFSPLLFPNSPVMPISSPK